MKLKAPPAYFRPARLSNNTRVKRTLWQAFAFFLFILLCHSIASPQTIQGSYTYRRNLTQLNELLSKFKEGKLEAIPECFFGKSVVYDNRLADLIIFIDRSGRFPEIKRDEKESQCLAEDKSVRFCLTKGGRQRTELFGERNVYVMIFVAEDSHDENGLGNQVTGSEKTKQITVHLSPLDWTRGSGEFVLLSIIRSIASVLATGLSVGTSEKAASPAEGEKPISVPMSEVGNDGKTRLFFGIMKIPLNENTINRITVGEKRGDVDYNHLATFGNYSGSIISSSIGLMATRLERYNPDSPAYSVDAFIFVHLYLKRPQMPAPRYPNDRIKTFRNKISWSLVAGTKLSKNLFDDLFFGASVGHFLSTVGLVAGVNYRTLVTKRKPFFCFGVTFML